MVRGYQKRIIHLKNTESDAFDEAFFLIGEEGSGMDERDLIAEANRIISECSSGRRRGIFERAKGVIIFIAGALTGGAICSIAYALLTLV